MSIELSKYQPNFHERWVNFPGLEGRLDLRNHPQYKFHKIIGDMK